MTPLQRIWAFREGGQTKRCHTMNHIGYYDVAQHSYNMLSMLFAIYPGEPSLNLIKAIQFHDTPERWTGDVPKTAKMACRNLKLELEELEECIIEKLGLDGVFSGLTDEEAEWLSGLDLLELAFWAEEQSAMWNSMITPMHAQIRKLFLSKIDSLPPEIRQLYFHEFGYYRSPECHELLETKE